RSGLPPSGGGTRMRRATTIVSKTDAAVASGFIAAASTASTRRRAGSSTASSHEAAMTGYAELQVTSNFSFLRGASHPGELVAQAAHPGHGAIAIADPNTLAGVVRAHGAAKARGLRLIVGARLDPTDGPSLLCLPTDRLAYGRLSRLL